MAQLATPQATCPASHPPEPPVLEPALQRSQQRRAGHVPQHVDGHNGHGHSKGAQRGGHAPHAHRVAGRLRGGLLGRGGHGGCGKASRMGQASQMQEPTTRRMPSKQAGSPLPGGHVSRTAAFVCPSRSALAAPLQLHTQQPAVNSPRWQTWPAAPPQRQGQTAQRCLPPKRLPLPGTPPRRRRRHTAAARCACCCRWRLAGCRRPACPACLPDR